MELGRTAFSMNNSDIADILKKHVLWVHERRGGSRADLSLKDLRRFNFDGQVLARAKLVGTNFSKCSMRGADLVRSDLFSGTWMWKA